MVVHPVKKYLVSYGGGFFGALWALKFDVDPTYPVGLLTLIIGAIIFYMLRDV